MGVTVRAIKFVFKGVALVPLVVFGWAFDGRAQRSETPAGALPAWNDNALMEIQRRGGDPARAGDVKMEFYGHDAFKITSPGGVSVLTDPWRNDPTGQHPKWFVREFPAIRVDIVLSTHAHFDHDAVGRPNGLTVLERLVGQFKLGDVEIMGLADKHQCESPPDPATNAPSANCPPSDAVGLDNAIEILETGGLRIVIWGDNRAAPDPSLGRYLRNIDVLVLPVDTVLSRAEADAIIKRYDPKAIIPSHYLVEGLTTHESGLESADGWVHDEEKNHHADVRRLDDAELTLNAAELKGSHHRIYYFGNHIETK